MEIKNNIHEIIELNTIIVMKLNNKNNSQKSLIHILKFYNYIQNILNI